LCLFQGAKLASLNLENSGQGLQTVQDLAFPFAKRLGTKGRKMAQKEVLKPLLEKMDLSDSTPA
jgi:hypothetical protein